MIVKTILVYVMVTMFCYSLLTHFKNTTWIEKLKAAKQSIKWLLFFGFSAIITSVLLFFANFN